MYLGAAKDSDYLHEEYSKTGAFKWEFGNEGHLDETVRHTQITAGGDIKIDAGNGVIVDYKHDDTLSESINSLSQLPELAWMGELRKRNDINWQAIEEAHEQWQQHEEGVGGPGVTLVMIAVAITTGGGAGTGILGLGEAAAAGSLTAVQVAQIAIVDSLVDQAITSLIVNGGDIGAVFKDLVSTDSLLNLATAGITAGITNSLFDSLDIPQGVSLSQLDTTQLVQASLINASVKSTLDTALYGESFGDAFKCNLQTSAVNAVGAKLAAEIGAARDAGDINYAVHKIAHAAVGCGLAAGSGGECAGGAIGAVAGEIAGEAYFSKARQEEFGEELGDAVSNGDMSASKANQLVTDWEIRGINLAKLVGGLSALVASEDVDSAVQTGGNAVENNLCGTGLCVAGVVWLIGAALTTMDVYNTYEENGPEAALEQLAIDGAITVVAGVAGKTVYKIGDKLYDKASDAWTAYRKGESVAKSGADNIATLPKLNKQLQLESANSKFTSSGTLTQTVIQNSRKIIDSSKINNPNIPKGYSKYTTETYHTPSGNFKSHFYRNDKTGEVFYGQDYKSILNSKSGVQQ